MLPLRLLLIAPLILTTPALAQGTQQEGAKRPQNTQSGPRTPVAARPSNNPFQNPIGQGVPPATSANPNQNGNRTNIYLRAGIAAGSIGRFRPRAAVN